MFALRSTTKKTTIASLLYKMHLLLFLLK